MSSLLPKEEELQSSVTDSDFNGHIVWNFNFNLVVVVDDDDESTTTGILLPIVSGDYAS
jgi:hypothetical protein